MQPLQPTGYLVNRSAYDPIRSRYVFVADNVTWEWDGTRWSGAPRTTPTRIATAYWNADRLRIQAITATAPAEVWDWDGTAWSRWAVLDTLPPGSTPALAAYDPARHYTLGINVSGTVISRIDVNANVTFAVSPPVNPGVENGGSMVFDANTNTMLVHGYGPVLEFDGTAWSTSSATMLPDRGGRLLYNLDAGRVWLAGGEENSVVHGNIYERAFDGTWSRLPLTLPTQSGFFASEFEMFYDPMRNELVHCLRDSHGGVDIWDAATSTWRYARVGFAPVDGTLVADPVRRRMIYFGGRAETFEPTSETWAWDGATWEQLSTVGTPEARTRGNAVHDATWGSVLLFNGTCDGVCTDTWELVDSTWTNRGTAGPPASNMAVTYDPARRRVVAALDVALWELPSNGDHWQEAHELAYFSMESMAWSARDGLLTATEGNRGVFDLVGEQWVPTLSPGQGYAAVEDGRVGGVLYVPTGATTQLWQRIGSSWQKIDSAPLSVTGAIAIDPSAGRLVMVGFDGGGSTVTLVRTVASANPTESCVDGDDRDGDGLPGCSDLDCWYACPDRCPPYTTCP